MAEELDPCISKHAPLQEGLCDRESYLRLISGYDRTVLAILLRLTHSEGSTRRLFQEVFLDLYGGLQRGLARGPGQIQVDRAMGGGCFEGRQPQPLGGG